MTPLRCTLRTIRYSGARYWSVAEATRHDNGTLATICGPLVGCSEGDSLELTGKWDEDPRFGPQYKFRSARVVLPSDSEGIAAWLCKLPEIGRNRALALIQRFGAERIFGVIEREHERLAEVDGITLARAEQIRAAYAGVAASTELQTFLRRYISTDWQVSVVLAWARDAGIAESGIEQAIRANPYRLTEIDGFGFLTVDRIARRMGVSFDHVERARAGVLHLLGEAKQEGHCCQLREQLLRSAHSEYGIPGDSVREAVGLLLADEQIAIVDDNEVYLTSLRHAEITIRDVLRRLTAGADHNPPEDEVPF